MKQQFNVNLEGDLVRRLKHHSIDAQLSLSDLVTHVFTRYLDQEVLMTQHDQPRHDDPTPPRDPADADCHALDLVLQPMVHVEHMAATVDFLEALGGRVAQGSRDGDWVQVGIGGAELGLLAHPANPEQGEGDVELMFASRTPLERVEEAARAAGLTIEAPTSDEGFGRQLQLRTPDGLLVKVNEIEPDLIS